MDESKLRDIVEEVINKAVEPINQRLDGIEGQLKDPDTGLKRLNDHMDANTAAVMELEKTIKGYGDMYKINDANARKLEKRVETLEENMDIQPPPELTFAEVS